MNEYTKSAVAAFFQGLPLVCITPQQLAEIVQNAYSHGFGQAALLALDTVDEVFNVKI